MLASLIQNTSQITLPSGQLIDLLMETTEMTNQHVGTTTSAKDCIDEATNGSAPSGTRQGRKILVAVDGSAQSHFAVQYALRLICTSEDRLNILHVSEPVPILVPGAAAEGMDLYIPADYVEELQKRAAAESTAIVKKYAAMAADAKVPCEGYFLSGDARNLIVEQTADMEADLLVLGCRGLGPIKEALLGSVSMHCLHHATCPVLIVRCPEEGQSEDPSAGVEKDQRTVLMAVDQSEASKEAVSWALRHFCHPGRDHLVLLTAKATPSMWPNCADLYPADVAERLEAAELQEAQKLLDTVIQKSQEMGFSATTRIESGDARDVICEAAQRLKANVVVLGRRGLSSVSRLVLGSVSNYCCHHLPCPVLIVKTHGDTPLEHPPHANANSAHLA